MKKGWKILLIVVVALAVILGGGFFYLYYNGLSGMSANTEPQAGQIRVACVGDSITYGHGIQAWKNNNYPAVLQQILGEAYHVANFGSSGACLNPDGDQPYTSRAVYQESLDYDADILIIMLGSNDSKPENWTDAQTFLSQYEELLETYLSGEKKPKIYVGLCAEAYYVNGETSGPAGYDIQPAVVEEIVEALRGMTAVGDHPVEILDIHTLTEGYPECFAKDGIHPDKNGARAIAEYIAEMIQ